MHSFGVSPSGWNGGSSHMADVPRSMGDILSAAERINDLSNRFAVSASDVREIADRLFGESADKCATVGPDQRPQGDLYHILTQIDRLSGIAASLEDQIQRLSRL